MPLDIFEIDLTGSSSLFSSPALPSSLSLSSFTTRLGSFDDESPPGALDLLMSVTSLSPIPLLKGDLNRDGHVNESDITAMEQALSNLSGYQTSHDLSSSDLIALADMDGSGTVTNSDLQSLIDMLRGGDGSAVAVPEPSGLGVLAMTALLCSLNNVWGRKPQKTLRKRFKNN